MAEDMTRGPLKMWMANGMSILCHDGPRDAGMLTVDELLEFVTYAKKHFPDEKVLVHQFGLRVTRYDGQKYGPALDWRDWT